MDWKQRIRAAFTTAGHDGPDAEILEELAQHAGALYAASRAEGLSPPDAQHRLDGQLKIWARDAHGMTRAPRRPAAPASLEPPAETHGVASRAFGIALDIRYASRLLRRRPGASFVAMLTMALGIGSTTVLFSLAWGVLMKPLPWPDSDRLVRISETRQGSTRAIPGITTNGTYLAWKEAPATIEGIAGYSVTQATLSDGAYSDRVRVGEITPGLFALLRAAPVLGATFREDQSSDALTVLSYGFWEHQFGRDPGVLGRTIRIDREPHTIVGVMPREFYFPDRDVRAWIPLPVPPVVTANDSGRTIAIFSGIARLKPGVAPQQAGDEATARARAAPDAGLTAMALFGSRGDVTVAAAPMLDALTRDVRPALIVFLIAVGLLLATATANVASVQLAHATTRRREMAIRAALGAASGRLARQLLVENLLLGLMGGALGLIGAFWLHRALPSLLPAEFPRALDVAIDLRVLAFAVCATVIASLAFGMLPALHARRVNLLESLNEDSLAPVGGMVRTKTARLRALIMAGQIAVACVLLVGASLLIRTFAALLSADRGYDVSDVLTARVPLPATAYTPQRRAALMSGLIERLSATPGVTRAAFTSILPLGGAEALQAFTMPPASAGGEPVQVNSALRTVSPGYMAAMGIRTVEGRGFTGLDTATSLPVIVVNRTFARKYVGSSPIGRRVPASLEDDKPDWEIIGVVDDTRMGSLNDPPQPEMFVSYAQLAGVRSGQPSIVVRTTEPAATFVPQLRAIVRDLDPSVALDSVGTMEQRLLRNLARPRLYAVMLGGFAAFALAIAAVGLFGVLSYSVAQRSREIAVRSALGARPSDIVRLVLSQGLAITAVGLALGIGAAAVLARFLATFVYGVTVHDRVTFIAVPVLLAAAAALACAVPASRAAKLDPLKTLRG